MRTVSISNDQHIVNNLAKANYVIDKFINSCSHSLRGPIKTIRGLVSLMDNGEPSNSQDCMLRMIETTANQLEHTLNELEQFLVNSKKEVTAEKVNMESLAYDLINKYKSELILNDISISVETEGPTLVYTDRERVAMILSMILTNAITYSDPTKKTRWIGISISVSGSTCEVSISDNGVGIAEEIKSKIYQLFYRGSERSKGSGIGLYIVHEAVEKMGGQIQMESNLHEGTKFTVSVPIETKK